MKEKESTAHSTVDDSGKAKRHPTGKEKKKTSEKVQELERKIIELEEEKRDWNERWARTAAEYDNYRKRTQKERVDLIKRANENLLEELLGILDDFENALSTDPSKGDMSAFVQGMQLIHDKIVGVLNKKGLEKIIAVAEPFDPNLHEAMMVEYSTEIPENHIIHEIQKGYTLDGKVLRPSKVIVSKGPSEGEEEGGQT
jgi:molecular chaperone GrpE